MKKMTSLILVLAICLGLFQPMTITAAPSEESTEDAKNEIDKSTYDALGLNLPEADTYEDAAPYSTTAATTPFVASEVYVATNGAHGNTYTLRDGLNRMVLNNDGKNNPHIQDDWGRLHGAYAFYGISDKNINWENGKTHGSELSSNWSKNIIAKADNGFSGIYATSVAFKGGDGKDNYVAELRAYGETSTTKIDGLDYKGAIEVEIYKIGEDGSRNWQRTLKPTVNTSIVKKKEEGAHMTYFERRYVQELDALFEIEAADIDGDGKDEIFVYCGAYEDKDNQRNAIVDVFPAAGAGTKSTLKISGGPSANYSGSTAWDHIIKKHPVVTLAGGDIDRDNKDEIAVTISAPTDHKKVAEAGRCTVYTMGTGQGMSLKAIPQLTNLSLTGSDDKAMVSANSAFGNFELPNTSIVGTVLIVGGYQTNNSGSAADSGGYGTAAYRFAYYNPKEEKYVISDYKTQGLGSKSSKIANSYWNFKDGYYRPTHAPLALACADLEGWRGDNNNDELLFGGEVYNFNITSGLQDEIGSISLSQSQVHHGDTNKDKEQVWIGDVVVGCVDSKPGEKGWRESFLCVVGTRRDKKVNDKDDYYWMDLAGFWLEGEKKDPQSSQEGVMAESNRRNHRYGTFVSLCLPDVDHDSVVMKYRGKYMSYSNPEIYAVLQASPYFHDLAENYDYIGNGGTAYETTSSSSQNFGASISQSVGAYVSTEVQLFGGAEIEGELAASFGYDYANTTEIEHAVSYNNQGGTDDKVVVYTVPYIYYVYDTYNPVHKVWGTTILPSILDPVTTILNVESYDEIAKESKGALYTIRDNVLYSTPGQPETYANRPAGKAKYVAKGGYLQVNNNAGADITKSISYTETNDHQFELGLTLNTKVGVGAAALGNKAMAGITTSTYAGFSSGFSKSKGTTFSGTVDNLPETATAYSFAWNLIVNEILLDQSGKKSVWVVGYDVKDVVQPPKVPKDLTITEVTADSISLEWESTDSAAYYILSMVDYMGNYNEIATLPYTASNYTKTDLESNTNYEFSIRAVSATKGSSMDSPIVAATTMSGGANFELITNPENLEAAPGKEGVFQASAVYLDKNGQEKTVKYEWQLKAGTLKAEWSKITSPNFSGASSKELKFPVALDMDGWEFRCRVYADNKTLYTKAATLRVGKSKSKISLDADSLDDQILSASGNKVISQEATVIGRAAAALEQGGKFYSLMAKQTEFYWFDGSDYYAYAGGKPELTDGVIGLEQEFTGDNIGDKQTIVKSDYEATILKVDGDGNLSSQTISGLVKQAQVGEPTITYDEITYTAKAKWTASHNAIQYSFYEAQADIENEKGDIDYLYTTDNTLYHGFTMGSTAKIDGMALDELVTVFQKTKTTVTSQEWTPIKGESYNLKASPKSGDGKESLIGDVTFVISGTVGETVKAVLENGQYTASWTPQAQGKFTVRAVFAGNDAYKGSTSDPITVYTVMPVADNAILDLAAPANVTYGGSANLALTEITYANKSSAKDVTQDASYTVKKLVEGDYTAAAERDYTLNKAAGTFTPKTFANFQITAEYGDQEVSTIIIVSKGTLLIRAQDTKKSVNDDNRKPNEAEVLVGVSWEDISLTEGQDYTLTSDGEWANVSGIYPITITLKNNANINDLQQRYSFNLGKANYTLTSTGYQVIANAGSNGNVSISSEFAEGNVGIPVTSGDNLPEKSKVTITATPNAGYIVSGWKVGGNYLLEGEAFVTDTTYTIDSLEANTVVEVEFSPGVNRLTFGPNSGNGTVTANHLNGGIPGDLFNSGENVNFNQTIRLSAQPKSGYAIEKWEVTRADETIKILAVDGVSDFTGSTYDFSRFNKDTVVKVYFVKNDNPKIIIRPVDKDQNPFSNVTVTVNGAPLSAENGIYSYTGETGDNLSITVTPTDGLLVQEWNVASPQTPGSLTNNNQTMTLYNLRSNIDFTVVCAALNNYKVSFEGQLDGQSFDESIASVRAIKIGSGQIETASRQLKGSTIQFTATAAKGYEIMRWQLNGQEVTATLTNDYKVQTYQIPKLSQNESLVITFRAKPTISWEAGIGGTMVVTATKDGKANEVIENPSYVDYGSPIRVTVTPDMGYIADDLVGVILGEAPHDSDVRTGDISQVEENINLISTFTALDTKEISYSVVVQDGQGGGHHGKLKGAVSRKNMTAYILADQVPATNGKQRVYQGGEMTLTSVADTGYRVKEWHVDGVKHQEDGRDFTGSVLILPYEDRDKNITLQFELGDAKITFSKPDYGTLSAKVGDVDFHSGGTSKADVAFTASPELNYEVKQWTANGKVQDGQTASTFTYKPNNSNVVIAVELQGRVLNLTTQGGTGGRTVPVGRVRYGESVTLNGTADTGYTFDGWYLEDVKISDMAQYTFTPYADGDYQARFSEIVGKTVSFNLNSQDMGTISAAVAGRAHASGSEVSGGKPVKITVIAEEGYRLREWTGLPENAQANKETASFIMGDKDIDVTAVMEEIPIRTITINPTTHGAITVELDGRAVTEVLDGTEVTVTARADANWMLDQWTDDGEGQTDMVFTMVVTQDMMIGATFKDAVNYTVEFSVIDGANGAIKGRANGTSISANTQVQCVGGSRLVFTALPDEDFMVKEWRVDGEIQADNLSNTLILGYLSKNTIVTVEYEELKLHNIPQSGKSYKISEVSRLPSDYGTRGGDDGVDQIRDRGAVNFTVKPEKLGLDQSGYIGKLIINGYNCLTETGSYEGGEIFSHKNEDGSYTIRVSHVTQDIIAIIEANKMEINEAPNEYPLSEEAEDALKRKLEITELKDLAAAIKGMLGLELGKISVSNARTIAHYDVSLKKWENDTWIPVTRAEEFPEEGLDVVLPYPIGAGIRDSYTIAHMYTTRSDQHDIGDVEIFTANGPNKYTAKIDGIHIHIDSLSPFAIGWTKYIDEPPSEGGGGGGGRIPVAVHTIEADDTVGGTITPKGAILVKNGKDEVFEIQADAGYLISDVLVDGKSVGVVNSFTFEKVKEDHTIFASFIQDPSLKGTGVAHWLETQKHMAYLGGYVDGSFKANNNMTRAEVAAMFHRLLLDKDVAITTNFSDVPANAWYETSVNTLASIGVIRGVGGNEFAPNRPITRAEFVVMAMRFADLEFSSAKVFTDVSPSDWFYEPISGAVEYGWISGYKDGSFRPGSSITRAEVAAIVNSMLERSADIDYVNAHEDELHLFPDLPKTSWAYYVIIEASNTHDYSKSKGKETWGQSLTTVE